MRREQLKGISRIVVKLGTGMLTDEKKRPDLDQMERLVHQVSRQREVGREVILVSSGAVGAGMGILGFEKRPSNLAELQACAAVGQSRLMAAYERLFEKFGLHTAQVLLTHEDLQHHERHLNARNTLVSLLGHGVVPIINENDAVSFTELQFGDNDKLSALVTCLLPADLLVILTSVEGLVQDFGKAGSKILSTIDRIDHNVERIASGTTSATAVGGMTTKIQAGKIVVRAGIPLVVASGRKPNVLERILDGREEGTIFIPRPNKLRGRKRWIAFFHHPKGSLIVDEGAKAALRDGGKSLLIPGIIKCEGAFEPGDIVRICDKDGTEFARGITESAASTVQAGKSAGKGVVHRDNLVIL